MTSSHQITEVKQRWARIVLRMGDHYGAIWVLSWVSGQSTLRRSGRGFP